MADPVKEFARRDILRTAALIALISGASDTLLLRGAVAATKGKAKGGTKPPRHRIKIGKGVCSGPFGEVRFLETEEGPLLNHISAAGGLAVVDLTQGRFEAAIGKVRLTSAAILIAGKQLAWNEAGFEALIAAIAKEQETARAIMNLRGALLEARAYGATLRKEAKKKEGAYTKMLDKLNAAAEATGAKSFFSCTETTIKETVFTTVEEVIDVIKSAERQYQDCLAEERDRGACGATPPSPAKDLCAAGICATKSFVDIVTGTITVLTEIAEAVTKKVTTCTASFPLGQWPTPFDLPGPFKDLPGFGDSGKPPTIRKKEIDQARKLLKALPGFDGPLAASLLDGAWEMTALPASIALGGGATTTAYGVRIGLSPDCAQALSEAQVWDDSDLLWLAAISAMAALVPAFAAAAAAASVATDPAIVAAAAAAALSLSAAVVAAVLIVIAMIIAVFTFGSAIALVLAAAAAAGAITGASIEIAAIAAALIALLPPFGSYKGLVAPVVTF